jgi:transposase
MLVKLGYNIGREVIKMPRILPKIDLSSDQRQELHNMINLGELGDRQSRHMALRAKIVLMASEGESNKKIAEECGVSEKTPAIWRNSFIEAGMDGLKDHSGRGRHEKLSKYDQTILAKVTNDYPEASIRTLQQKLKDNYNIDVSHATVQRVMTEEGLRSDSKDSWLQGREPEFGTKQMQIVGLILNPHYQALAFRMVEKTDFQALQSHESSKAIFQSANEQKETFRKDSDPKSLLTAFLLHQELVTGPFRERNKQEAGLEFIDFMEDAIKHYSGSELHVVFHNSSESKKDNVRKWLDKHSDGLEEHTMKTWDLWLTQIEFMFRILTLKVVERGIFKTKAELVGTLIDCIKKYRAEERNFDWMQKV